MIPKIRILALALAAVALSACGDPNVTTPARQPAPRTGAISIAVSGLPAGATGSVTVSGPGGTRSVSGDATLEGLAPGTYTLVAESVTTPDAAALGGVRVFTAVPASQEVVVAPGRTFSATFAYTPATGALTVEITGLPAGSFGDVLVTRPDGSRFGVSANRTIEDLAPGRYMVTAFPVEAGGNEYPPTPATQDVVVSPRGTARAAVAYGPAQPLRRGTLRLAVDGLPAGASGTWELRAPLGLPVDGGRLAQGSTHLLTDLRPGTYTLIWQEEHVGVPGNAWGLFVPDLYPRQVTITEFAVTDGSARYALVSGGLKLSATGLPAGVGATWRLRAAGEGTVAGGGVIASGIVYPGQTRVSSPIMAGAYRLEWADVQVAVDGVMRTFRAQAPARELVIPASLELVEAAATFVMVGG